MIVKEIIEDIEGVLRENPLASEFDIAFASYVEDESGSIKVDNVEAYHWDEDEEFFLVPSGAAHLYKLPVVELKAGAFLKELCNIENKEILSYEAFAREQIKTLKDGSVASLNSPLWGTGVHNEARLIYFYHGKQP